MAESFIEIRQPIDPHLRRWMLFVDGENLTIRGQRLASEKQISLYEGPHYQRDVFVWIPGFEPTRNGFGNARLPVQENAVRAYYYTSLVGDEPRIGAVHEALWQLGFVPAVFKRDAGQVKAKGVDIALARDLLGHAYRDNFDVAVLMAGDGDYEPLVSDLMHLGKVVYVSFFGGDGHGLNRRLKLAGDQFFDLETVFIEQWRKSLSTSAISAETP